MAQNYGEQFIDIAERALAGPLEENVGGRYGSYYDKRYLGTKVLKMAGARIAFVELSPQQMRDKKLNPKLQFVDPHIISVTRPNFNPDVHFNRPEAEGTFGIVDGGAIGRELARPIYREPHGTWLDELSETRSEVLLSYVQRPFLDDGTQLEEVLRLDPAARSNRAVRDLI